MSVLLSAVLPAVVLGFLLRGALGLGGSLRLGLGLVRRGLVFLAVLLALVLLGAGAGMLSLTIWMLRAGGSMSPGRGRWRAWVEA